MAPGGGEPHVPVGPRSCLDHEDRRGVEGSAGGAGDGGGQVGAVPTRSPVGSGSDWGPGARAAVGTERDSDSQDGWVLETPHRVGVGCRGKDAARLRMLWPRWAVAEGLSAGSTQARESAARGTHLPVPPAPRHPGGAAEGLAWPDPCALSAGSSEAPDARHQPSSPQTPLSAHISDAPAFQGDRKPRPVCSFVTAASAVR